MVEKLVMDRNKIIHVINNKTYIHDLYTSVANNRDKIKTDDNHSQMLLKLLITISSGRRLKDLDLVIISLEFLFTMI